MECPNCHSSLPSHKCPACDEDTPAQGKFCCHCGTAMPEPEENGEKDHGDFADRVLCSDGTCIGIINKDGVCSECGNPYTGEPE